MPQFRPPDPPEPLNREIALQQAADLASAGTFLCERAQLTLEWDHAEREDLSWEIFQGRLLDPAHTRERRLFETWNSSYQIRNRRSLGRTAVVAQMGRGGAAILCGSRHRQLRLGRLRLRRRRHPEPRAAEMGANSSACPPWTILATPVNYAMN